MTKTMRDAGREFLARGRFALVGASRDEKSFSRYVLRELLRRGYDVVPVNVAAAEMEGRRCFARVQDVSPPVDAALLMTPRARTGGAVADCLAAGVRHVWMHRGGGPGAATPEAVARCQAAGIEPIVDLCPFMTLPHAGWFHQLHGVLRGVGRRQAVPASGA
jgi:predicted CoA-binding protein